MSAVSQSHVSPEEYLRRERCAPYKSEYHLGEVVAMAGATHAHNRISGNVFASLHRQLRERPCNSYISDMRVSVRGGERYLYPDVVVTCGPELFDDGKQDVLLNPVVVIEVLSPSTESYDRGAKFLYYQSVPSLVEYVLVSQSSRRIEIFRKQAGGFWLYLSYPYTPPPIVLESINCSLTFEDVYSKVDIEGEATADAGSAS